MTHPYIVTGQAWAFALRILLDYPSFEPARHTVAFSSSGPRDIAKDLHLANLAIEMQRDFVHLTFGDIDAAEPSEIGLAVLGVDGVRWLPRVVLFAASEKTPLELLHGDKRWRIDERNQLVSHKLPARHLVTRGEQTAWRRLRERAAELGGAELKGGKFVSPGGTYRDSHDLADLRVAA
jgi:hypothetical protein